MLFGGFSLPAFHVAWRKALVQMVGRNFSSQTWREILAVQLFAIKKKSWDRAECPCKNDCATQCHAQEHQRMDCVPKAIGIFASGVHSNWWGLGCPAHCFGSSCPLRCLRSRPSHRPHLRGSLLCLGLWTFTQVPRWFRATNQPGSGPTWMSLAPSSSFQEDDEINLAVVFQGLKVSVVGPASKPLDFIHKLDLDYQVRPSSSQKSSAQWCLLAPSPPKESVIRAWTCEIRARALLDSQPVPSEPVVSIDLPSNYFVVLRGKGIEEPKALRSSLGFNRALPRAVGPQRRLGKSSFGDRSQSISCSSWLRRLRLPQVSDGGWGCPPRGGGDNCLACHHTEAARAFREDFSHGARKRGVPCVSRKIICLEEAIGRLQLCLDLGMPLQQLLCRRCRPLEVRLHQQFCRK